MHGVKAAMRHPPRVLKSCRQQLRRAGGAMVMSAQWPYSLGGVRRTWQATAGSACQTRTHAALQDEPHDW